MFRYDFRTRQLGDGGVGNREPTNRWFVTCKQQEVLYSWIKEVTIQPKGGFEDTIIKLGNHRLNFRNNKPLYSYRI